MATNAISKRLSRLNSHESFTKATTERKLRSRKVIISHQTSQKINARSRKLLVSINNNPTPIKSRLRPRQNKKNYCEDSKLLQKHLPCMQQDSIVRLEKLNLKDNRKVPVYKTIRSEKSLEEKSDIYDFKFDVNDIKEKIVKKKWKKGSVNKGKAKITKKTTRKKFAKKLETIDNEVTKSQHETNLPVEITQNNPPLESVAELIITESEKKDIVKETETPRICIDTHILMVEESVEEDTTMKTVPKTNTDIQMVKELMKEDVKKNEISETGTSSEIKGETSISHKTFAEQIKKQNTKKPRIISIENANKILVSTSSPNNTENLQSFRSKNIFNNKTAITKQYNNTLKCSLLTKSLSPISNVANTFNFGSPWRPTAISVFSQAKHFIQSTPNINFETSKDMELNKENMEGSNENVDMNKENIEINKQNKYRTDKERKKILHKKRTIPRKLQAEAPKEVQASKPVPVLSAPARVSLGEIKNLLQEKQDINIDKTEAVDEAHIEVDKLAEQKNKELIEFLNFSDTFDILSETERQSNIGNDVPLFMDLEPSHFSKPPQHSYRRKRNVRFDFSEANEEEGEKENIKSQTKKKKLTKSEKEHEKRINEWIKTVNSTFQEIDEHNLLIE